jgi:hypothetical protein
MPEHATGRWDSDSETILRRLWGEGKSAAVIAGVMHCSRSTITGKLWRMNLLGRGAMATTMMARTSTRTDAHHSRRDRAPPAEQAVGPKPHEKTARDAKMNGAPTSMQPVPFLAAQDHHCRAIVADRGPDGLVMFCGAPRTNDSSFCARHCAEFYTSGARS